MGRKVVISVPHGCVGAEVLLITSTVCARGLKTLANGAERLCLWSQRALEFLGSTYIFRIVFNMIQLCCVAIGSSNRG